MLFDLIITRFSYRSVCWCTNSLLKFQANHEIKVCDRCDSFFCKDCDEMDQCDDCGEVVCSGCCSLLSCKFCGGGLCEECAVACGRSVHSSYGVSMPFSLWKSGTTTDKLHIFLVTFCSPFQSCLWYHSIVSNFLFHTILDHPQIDVVSSSVPGTQNLDRKSVV